MGVAVDIVASRVSDQYYGNFAANSDFFKMPDFIARVGYVMADFYKEMYREQYAELRAFKTDSIVTFDPLTLNEQILKVEKVGNSLFAKYDKPIMSFGYDQNVVGVQYVNVIKPMQVEAERIAPQSEWQLNSVGYFNKVFFIPTKTGIRFVKKGACNVSEVSVLYVPATDKGGYEVPDVLVDDIINRTVAAMRELKPPVIKKTADQNQNMVMESEINKNAVK